MTCEIGCTTCSLLVVLGLEFGDSVRSSAGLSGGADGVGIWMKGHSLVHRIVGTVAAAMDSCCIWNYARLMYLRIKVSCTLPASRIGEGLKAHCAHQVDVRQ